MASSSKQQRTMSYSLIIGAALIVAVSCASTSNLPASSSKSPSASASSSSASSSSASSASASPASVSVSLVGQTDSQKLSTKSSGASTPIISASSFVPHQAGDSKQQLDHNDQYSNGFDGRNPFSDDSLWQIPIHLAKDLSASNDNSDEQQQPIMSASQYGHQQNNNNGEMSNLDDDSDSDYSPSAASDQTRSISLLQSSPTQVISASSVAGSAGSVSDLKTAAGYHYPSSYSGAGHHGGHHSGGAHHDHYGGHSGGASHGADHYHGKYYQFASVPYPGAWEYGYRRGNPYHTIERHEHAKGPHFQTKVKWSDKHGGYGVHVWDYNHDDHHSHHSYDHDEHHAAPEGYGHGHHHASAGHGHGAAHKYGHH